MLKYQVTREDSNSNDYNLVLIVPQTVETTFTAKVTLYHPFTKVSRVLNVKFDWEEKTMVS